MKIDLSKPLKLLRNRPHYIFFVLIIGLSFHHFKSPEGDLYAFLSVVFCTLCAVGCDALRLKAGRNEARMILLKEFSEFKDVIVKYARDEQSKPSKQSQKKPETRKTNEREDKK